MFKVTTSFKTAAEAAQFFITLDASQQSACAHHPEAVPESACERPTTISVLIKMLEDPRYKLRSVSSLIEAAGLSTPGDIFDLLNVNDVNVRTKRRRGDNELLVGLSSRN